MPAINITIPAIPSQVKTIQSPYDYAGAWAFLHTKGLALYGHKFRLYPEDAGIILKLIAWCFKDEEMANSMGVDLEKGIMLKGAVGCGKTSLMNCCRFLLQGHARHAVKPCREVAFEFMKEGHESFHKYTRGSFHHHPHQPKVYCFDDLGLESTGNFYGNQCAVMAEILLSRYEMFHSANMLTHITTNLNSADIEALYGLRVRSRCREMFNLISFDVHTSDKRR